MEAAADRQYRRAVIGGIRECAKRIERTLTDLDYAQAVAEQGGSIRFYIVTVARLAFDLSRRLEPCRC